MGSCGERPPNLPPPNTHCSNGMHSGSSCRMLPSACSPAAVMLASSLQQGSATHQYCLKPFMGSGLGLTVQ